MTGTDWLDQLEQKAAAATAGEWETVEEQTIHSATGGVVGETWEDADAEFIAAANPHTVQRLINELREANNRPAIPPKLLMDYRVVKDQARRQQARADALAAKVAAVEALLVEREEEYGDLALPDLRALIRDLRAALAAPTDTTDGSDQ